MSGYTHRATGTWSTAGSPGDPAGKTAGDLLLMIAAARLSSETINAAPTGWTLLFDTSTTTKEQLAIFGRIATGDASDTVSAHDFWSGTSHNVAQIAAFYGDVFAGGLGSIVAHSVAKGSDSGTANLPHDALTISTADCLVLGLGVKQKTVTSDGATLTDPAWMTSRLGFKSDNGSTVHAVWGYVQQSTAANISAGSWTQSIAESLHYASIVVALKTSAATVTTLKLLAEASAASAASIEGVVLNAARDTVIGEFSGQAFEAALEGGEAVLLVPVSEITPDGSTLTTSDTPIVFAYNATDSIIGPGSATVVEI